MKYIPKLFLYFFFLKISLIFSQAQINNTYIEMSLKNLASFSENILPIKGKTNKTKCIANEDIRVNDVLFEFPKKDIITNENCPLPNKEKLTKEINLLTNDTITRNKLKLSFCMFDVYENPNTKNVPDNLKKNILNLPLNNLKYSEKMFDFPDLNEFLRTGRYYIEESDLIDFLMMNVYDLEDRTNKTFILFSKIYYYISYNSFNISDEVIILPFINICNIVPNYLNKENKKNYTNSTYIEFESNKYYLKAARSFRQNEQYLFSYNVPLDNDLLMAKQGLFIHDNVFDYYLVDKKYVFDSEKVTDDLLEAFKKRNINPEIYKYVKDSDGKDLWLQFKLLPEKIGSQVYSFGIVYFSWWKTHMKNKINTNEFKLFSRQTLMLVMRMCYDELMEIMKVKLEGESYDQYLLTTQENKTLTDVNRYLRNFNTEKLHLLMKNINNAYKDLVITNYNEIQKRKDSYVHVDPNLDV